MGRTMKRAIATVSVLVALLVVAVWLPINVWQRPIQIWVPKGMTVTDFSGHWWRGRAVITFPNRLEEAVLTWSSNASLKPWPQEWTLAHPMADLAGHITLDRNDVVITLDPSAFSPALLTQITPNIEGVKLLGERVKVQHWRMAYDWRQKRLTDFSGVANWTNGEIQYPLQHEHQTVQVKHWQVVASQYQARPAIALTDVSTQRHLAELSLEGPDQLALTLMPQLTDALGLSWRGGKRLPVLVMTYPLRMEN